MWYQKELICRLLQGDISVLMNQANYFTNVQVKFGGLKNCPPTVWCGKVSLCNSATFYNFFQLQVSLGLLAFKDQEEMKIWMQILAAKRSCLFRDYCQSNLIDLIIYGIIVAYNEIDKLTPSRYSSAHSLRALNPATCAMIFNVLIFCQKSLMALALGVDVVWDRKGHGENGREIGESRNGNPGTCTINLFPIMIVLEISARLGISALCEVHTHF